MIHINMKVKSKHGNVKENLSTFQKNTTPIAFQKKTLKVKQGIIKQNSMKQYIKSYGKHTIH